MSIAFKDNKNLCKYVPFNICASFESSNKGCYECLSKIKEGKNFTKDPINTLWNTIDSGKLPAFNKHVLLYFWYNESQTIGYYAEDKEWHDLHNNIFIHQPSFWRPLPKGPLFD